MTNELKKTWIKKKYCKTCKKYRTTGGLMFRLFGLFTIKVTTYKHECGCFEYKGETELDKEKCEEAIEKSIKENKVGEIYVAHKVEKENENND